MSDIAVEITSSTIAVELAVGAQGPVGPAGPPGGSAVTYTAGETLAAGRVVVIDGDEAFYFQPSDATHQGRAYGVTTTGATIGANVDIQIGGEITNGAFTFGSDTILWVYDNGIIVDTPPAATIIQQAGVSAGNLTMRIDFSFSLEIT